jgi:hypothetical protein
LFLFPLCWFVCLLRSPSYLNGTKGQGCRFTPFPCGWVSLPHVLWSLSITSYISSSVPNLNWPGIYVTQVTTHVTGLVSIASSQR